MHHLQNNSFFKYIYNVFGAIPVRLLKEWIEHRLSIYKSKLRIRFIKYCILNENVPPHLFGLQRFNIHLHDHTSKTKLDDLKNCFMKRLLKIELKDAYESMNHSCNQLFHLVHNITKNLPWKTAQKFFENQEKRLFSLFLKERQRIDGKLKWLTNRQNNDKNKNIQQIKYYWSTPNNTSPHRELSTILANKNEFSLNKISKSCT